MPPAAAALNLNNRQSGQQRRQPPAQCFPYREVQMSQRAVSFAQKPSEGCMANQPDTNPRTKADFPEWLKDKRQIAKEVRLALVSDFDHLRAPRKEIARHAGCSHRTVEAWTDPELPTVPGLEHFLRLIPRSPSIQKLLLQLMTLDPDQHVEYARVLSELRRLG
jgi:hypothetical protein